MFGHRNDKYDEDAQQGEVRGPVMGASANSNRTAAFDESSGILGFVSRRFRRSPRKKKKNTHLTPNPDDHEIGVFASQASGGHGAVAYARSSSSGSDDSPTGGSGGSSSGSISEGDHGKRVARKSAESKAVADASDRNERFAASRVLTKASPNELQRSKEDTARDSTRAPLDMTGVAVGSGKVHVTPSSSSSATSESAHPSDTEYEAPPSVDGDDVNNGLTSTDRPRVPLPATGPPVNAMKGGVYEANKAVSTSRQGELQGSGKRSEDGKQRGGRSAAVASSSSSSASSHGNRSTTETTSTSTTTATTTDTTESDTDNSDGSDDSDDADSVGRAYSKMTDQSEGPSSRVPFSNSGVRHHTLVSPASATYYAPTRDVRSSLVSTIDVDVAVVQERRRQRQHQLYLHAALHPGLSNGSGNPNGYGASGSANGLPPHSASTLTPAQSGFLRQRADAVYQRHMDAFVENYLSAPRYRTALAQFRKHMSAPEQQMRTTDAREQYLRATEVVVTRASVFESGGRGAGDSTDAFFNGAAAAGNESDWQRVGSGGIGGAGGTDGAFMNSVEAASGQPVKSGADRYRLEKTDLELLAGDSARRARLLDDTLPWRPIDFDATSIRLEALEHLQAEFGGADAMTGTGAVAPAVGGSVNLLIEVLILTEMDVPFTSTIPMVNYTNVFLLLASLFVQSEVLLTKFIRFYRSVRAWEAEVEDNSRAIYLERRILQCILVYCRVHETDLTLACLQRLAVFAASEGFLGPVNVLNDAIGKDQWPCQEGVYCASRRRAAVYAHAVANAAAAAGGGGSGGNSGASPTSTSHHGHPSFGGNLRHYKRHGFVEPRRAVDLGIAGLFPQRNAAFDPNALLNPATRAPLQNEVAQTLLEFIVYLQRTIVVYYRPVELPVECRQSLPFAFEGPSRMFVDTAVLRPSLGCTSSSLRTAMTADPRLSPEVFGAAAAHGGGGSSLGARFSERVSGSNGRPNSSSSSSPSRDQRYGAAGVAGEAAEHSLSLDGRQGPAAGGNASGWGTANAASGKPPGRPVSTLETTVMQKPLSVVEVDAEHLSRQICLLSFSLFTAVHIRELLNNAWTDSSMKVSVSKKLTELMEFSAHLQRWTAAIIVTPSAWAECQRGLRYFLEVCRMLYEQQNYEMAAAILEGLRHPAVEYLERAYSEARGQGLLSLVERRELETLQELMDPFASYSPSSLYSVTARTVGDMETPMIPLLSPILGVIFRSEDIKGSTVSIRSSDGQAVVNWSKIIGLGKMVVLWMRCQYTPFAFPVDPEMQEFLWSTMNHQWTDTLLMRAARRAKQ